MYKMHCNLKKKLQSSSWNRHHLITKELYNDQLIFLFRGAHNAHMSLKLWWDLFEFDYIYCKYMYIGFISYLGTCICCLIIWHNINPDVTWKFVGSFFSIHSLIYVTAKCTYYLMFIHQYIHICINFLSV